MNRAWTYALTAALVAAPAAGQNLDSAAELMRALTEAPGPPAFEEAVREIVVHTGIIQRSDFDQAVELLIQVLQRLDQRTADELASFR